VTVLFVEQQTHVSNQEKCSTCARESSTWLLFWVDEYENFMIYLRKGKIENDHFDR